MQGLKRRYYWLSMWLWNMFTYLAFTIIFMLAVKLVAASSFEDFDNANPFAFMLLIVCWGHALVGMAVLISALFPTGILASVIAYFLLLIEIVCIFPLQMVMQGKAAWPMALNLLPPAGFVRALYLAMNDRNNPGSSVAASMLVLVSGTFCLLLGIAIHTNNEGDGSTFSMLRHACSRAYHRVRQPVAARTVSHQTSQVDAINIDCEEDDDVAKERARVATGGAGVNDAAIKIENLTKIFPARGRHKSKRAGTCVSCLWP